MVDRSVLQKLVEQNLSQLAIGEALGKSQTNVRYWLTKHELKTTATSKGRTRSWSDEDLKEAFKSCVSIAEILRKFGLSSSPGNYRSLHRHAARLKIDLKSLPGKSHGKSTSRHTLEEILVKDSSHAGGPNLKQRLLKAGLLEYKCRSCGLEEMWNDKPITLQMDHINGDPFDHRLENLRILCPNCHSQTTTFLNKNRDGRYAVAKTNECGCGAVIQYRSKRCVACAHKLSETRTKISWPPIEDLQARLSASNYESVARELGVSSNAIRKHLRKYA